MARLDFERTYYDVAVQRVSHKTTKTLPNNNTLTLFFRPQELEVNLVSYLKRKLQDRLF